VQANDWLAVNQFSVVENKHTRRPDLVLFVNGLPLVVLELKNAANEDATIWTAFQRLQTDKAAIPALFATNDLLVVFDGVEARAGTLIAGRDWFEPWRTISGEALADAHVPQLQVVTEVLLAPRPLLDLVRDFIVFEDSVGGNIAKKMAGYHQELKSALATYIESGGTGRTALDQDDAVAVMLEKYDVCSGLFHDFDRSKWMVGSPQERLGLLPSAQEHILVQENGKDRCIRAVRELSQAFALAVPYEGRRCASATTWPSSRRCKRCSPRAALPMLARRRSWVTPCAR